MLAKNGGPKAPGPVHGSPCVAMIVAPLRSSTTFTDLPHAGHLISVCFFAFVVVVVMFNIVTHCQTLSTTGLHPPKKLYDPSRLARTDLAALIRAIVTSEPPRSG